MLETQIHQPLTMSSTLTSNVEKTVEFAIVTDDGMLEAKAAAMVLLGCVAAAIAFLPIGFTSYLNRRSESGKSKPRFCNNEFSFLFPFGGGVLLCTIFLHLLPEVTENVEELYKDKLIPEFKVPLPELLTCCGFFMMLFVDGITHEILHRFFHPKPSPEPSRGQLSTVQSSQLTPDAAKSSKWDQTTSVEANGAGSATSGEEAKPDDSGNDQLSVSESNWSVVNHHVQIDGLEARSVSFKHGHDHHHFDPHHHLDDFKHSHEHHHNHDHSSSVTHFDSFLISKVSLVRCFLFVLALSVHEFFEGLAIGLEQKVNAVYYLMFAVASHKLVIALCIGVEMVTTQIKFTTACVYILTYSIVSPAGILVGMMVLNHASTGSEINLIASALLQGLATGTLLYVVFFEVLTKTMSKHESGLIKMIAILVGFLAMLFLQISLGEEEDD